MFKNKKTLILLLVLLAVPLLIIIGSSSWVIINEVNNEVETDYYPVDVDDESLSRLIYDGAYHTIDYECDDEEIKDNLEFKYYEKSNLNVEIKDFNGTPGVKDAGEYVVYVVCNNDTLEKVDFSIGKKDLLMEVSDADITYGNIIDGNNVIDCLDKTKVETPFNITFTGFVDGEGVSNLTYDGSDTMYKVSYQQYYSAGVYEDVIDVLSHGYSSKNYNIIVDTGNLEVVKRDIHFTWSIQTSFVYNSEEQAPTAQIVESELARETDNFNLTVNGKKEDANVTPSGVSISSLTYQAEVENNYQNYNLVCSNDYASSFKCDFNIKQKEFYVDSWSDLNQDYDYHNQLFASVSFEGIIDNDDITYTLKYVDNKTQTVVTKVTEAGNYTVSIDSFSGTDVNNYCAPTTDLSNELVVNQLIIEYTWSAVSGLVYDADDKLTYVLSNISINNLKGDDCSAVLNAVKIGSSATLTNVYDAGSYTASIYSLEGKDSHNYKINPLIENSLDFVVAQKPIDISWSDVSSFVYCKQELGPQATLADDTQLCINKNNIKDTCTVITTGKGIEATIDEFGDQADGKSQYQSFATLSNPNYCIANEDTINFDIKPYGIDSYYGNSVDTASTYKAKAKNITYVDEIKNLNLVNYANSSLYNESLPFGFTYNGGLQNPIPLTNDLFEGDVVVFETLVTNISGITNWSCNADVGTYNIEILSIDNTNYYLKEKTTTSFAITPKEVEVGWGNTTFTYTGLTQCPIAYVIDDYLCFNLNGVKDICDVSVLGGNINACQNAETYTATTNGLNNGNYTLVNTSSTNYVINKAPLTITANDYLTLIYGDELGDNGVSYNGFVNGETVDELVADNMFVIGNYEYNYSRYDNIVADAVYTITPANFTAYNYEISYSSGDMRVNKRLISITPNGDTELMYNGETQIPEYITSNICSYSLNGVSYNDADKLILDVSGGIRNVGNSTLSFINLTGDKACNYQLPTDGSTDIDFSVVPLPIIISWTNLEFTYNKEEKIPTATISNIISGDVCNLTIDGKQIKAGNNYSANITAVDNANYTIVNGTYLSTNFTIYRKTVSIVWDQETFSFPYDGLEHYATGSLNGVVPGDNCTITASGKEVNAGNYSSAMTLEGNDAENYTFVEKSNVISTDKNFSITKVALNLSATNPNNIIYGDAAPTYSANLTGFVNGEGVSSLNITFSYLCSYTQYESGIGTYTIVPSVNETLTNYYINSTTNGSFVVNPKPVDIIWSDLALTYTGSILKPSANVDVDDLVANDECLVTLSMNKESINAGSDYLASVTLSNNNYTIATTSNSTQTFVINKAKVDVAWNSFNANPTYSGNTTTLTITVASRTTVSLDDSTGLPKGITVTYQYIDNSNNILSNQTGFKGLVDAGSYTVKAYVVDSPDNYDLYVSNSLVDLGNNPLTTSVVISPKTITESDITLSESTFTYSPSYSHKPTVTIGISNISSDDYVVTYGENIYPSTGGQVYITANGNYSCNLTVNFDIEKATPSVVVSNNTVEYESGNSLSVTTSSTSSPVITYTDLNSNVIASPTSIGKYSYTITVAENDCYKAATATGYYVIRKTFTVTMTDLTVTYSKNTFHCITYNGEIPSDSGITASYTINGSSVTTRVTNAGTYAVELILSYPDELSKELYVLSDSSDTSATLIINKQVLNVPLMQIDYASTMRVWDDIKAKMLTLISFTDSNGTSVTLTHETDYTITGISDGYYNQDGDQNNNIVGSTYLLTYTSTNYEFNNPLLKYKTAIVNGSYLTIEDAIKTGSTIVLEGLSGNDSYVLTSFSSLDTSITGYDSSCYKLNAKLRVPFADVDLDYHGAGGKNYSCSRCGATWFGHEKSYHGNNEVKEVTAVNAVYSALYIPKSVSVKISTNGDMVVGALFTSSTNVQNRGVVMNDGIIDVDGKIRAFGYVKGTGIVNLNSGATAIDAFKIFDWPGGGKASGLNSEKILPVSAFTMHNISCDAKIYAGATYECFWTIEFGNSLYTGFQRGDNNGNVKIIGSSGLFNLSSGYIMKESSEGKTYSTRTYLSSITGSNQTKGQKDIFKIYGTCSDGSVSLTISAGQSFTMSTSTDMALPIGYMDIRIASDGTNHGNITLSNNSYKFMPGSSLVVEKNATLSLGEGVNLLLYDLVSCYNDEKPGGTAVKSYPFVTSTTGGGLCVDAYDAYMIVNGTVNINKGSGVGGIIYTSSTTGKLVVNASAIVTDSKVSCSMTYATSYSEGILTDSYGSSKSTHYAKIYSYNGSSINTSTYNNVTAGTTYNSTLSNNVYTLS